MPKTVVCVATRGCICGKTVESMLRETKGHDVEFLFSNGRPIPDAQNYLMEESLKLDFKYQFWLEEDITLTKGLFQKMVSDLDDNDRFNIVSVAYILKKGQLSIQFFNTPGIRGKFLLSGMGCMLIRRSLLDSINVRPFFSDRFTYALDRIKGESLTLKSRHPYDPRNIHKSAYGLQDLYFWQVLNDNGGHALIYENIIVGHSEFKQNTERGSNNGCHVWSQIEPSDGEINRFKELAHIYAALA